MAESARFEMDQMLSSLSVRERKIIEMTYGMTDGLEMSPSDIAKHIGMSTESIRQIRNAALEKLKEKIPL